MDTFLKISALCLVGSMTALLLKKDKQEISVVVVLLCCITAVFLSAEFLKPVLSFAEELESIVGLERAIVLPVIKAVGIGILTELVAAFCQEAGQTALCKTAELCGTFLAAYTALPLARSVLQTIKSLIGG